MIKERFIIGLIVLITVLILVLLFSIKRLSYLQQSVPQATITPNLDILRVSPAEGPIFLPIQQIQFTFNYPIKPEDFHYTIEPSVETYPRQGENENTIILASKDTWKEGVTTIIVTTNTISVDGKRLLRNYLYKLNTGYPTYPNPDSKNY